MAEARLAVACVAPVDLHAEVDGLTGRVHVDPRALALPAGDAAAVEHALRLAAAYGLRPLVVAAGGPDLDPVLRELGGVGADVLRVDWPVSAAERGGPVDELAADEAALAAALADALRGTGSVVEVVVCADRSAGRGTGALPAFLAGELGVAQALGLVALEAEPARQVLRAERRLEAGRRELLEVPLPAVCSVEAAGVRLRRASLAGALSAAGAPVAVHRPPAAGRSAVRVRGSRPYVPRPRPVPAPTGSARERLLGLTGALSEREPPTVLGPLEPEAAAGALLAYLDRNGFPLPAATRPSGQPAQPAAGADDRPAGGAER